MNRNFSEKETDFPVFKIPVLSRFLYMLLLLAGLVCWTPLFVYAVQPSAYSVVVYYYYDNPTSGNNERKQLTFQDLAAARQILSPGKMPVLFVHGHNFWVNENYKNSWIESEDDASAATFKKYLDKPENAYLNIEAYYIHFKAADQNRSIVEDAREIGQAINLILMRHDPAFDPTNPNSNTGVKVAVIAHSKGTISTRLYLKSLTDQQYNLPPPPVNLKPVSEFIALSPPNHGLIPTLDFSLSRALRQIYNGYNNVCKKFDMDSNTTGIQTDPDSLDFIQKLNGHAITDTMSQPTQFYADEAPGSRADGRPLSEGVLYVCIYADNDRDLVGGSNPSDDCQGRKLAKNLAQHAENTEVSTIQGGDAAEVHKNTLHTPEVICKALYTAAYHRVPPSGFSCAAPVAFEVIPVLDHSGSMAGYATNLRDETKITALQRAARLFVDLLGPDAGHSFGLVRFSKEAVTDMLLDEFDQDARTQAHEKIGNLVPDSLTSIGAGLKNARTEFRDRGDSSKNQAILLLSDGKENTAPWISYVRDEILAKKIKVYAVGFGYGAGIAENDLSQLAEGSGGQYHITNDNLVLSKYFCQILGNLVGWQVIYDPVFTLQPGDKKTHPVKVCELDDDLIFVVCWTGDKGALALTLCRPPSGIAPDTAGDCIEVPFTMENDYAYCRINKSTANWSGSWEVRVEAEKPVRYSLLALADSGIRLETGFDKKINFTGEEIRVWAKLSGTAGVKLPATITTTCDRPMKGVGNVLHDYTYDPLKFTIAPNQDTNPANLKLDILRQQSGEKEILPRGSGDLLLFDDGQHQDGKPGDGYYANTFADTRIQGSYTFRFLAEEIPTGRGSRTRREWVQSLFNEVKIEPDFSDINITLLDTYMGDLGLTYRYQVKVAPRDRFGNYLGPGHSLVLNIKYKEGGRSESLDDFIDGVYGKTIDLARSQVESGTTLHIGVDGKDFTTVKKLPTLSDWSLSLHGAATFPTGHYKNLYNPGFAFILDMDYRLSPRLSLQGLLGYSRFNSASTLIPDTDWWNLSVNLKYRFPGAGFIPYINSGTGLYIPGSGSARIGFNVGAGLDYPLNPNWSVEVGGDFHHIFMPGTDFLFFTSHLGLIYRF